MTDYWHTALAWIESPAADPYWALVLIAAFCYCAYHACCEHQDRRESR